MQIITKLSKNRLISVPKMPSERKLAIYKNVHNVQNFVDNYKNKHFIFKNAESPDKY